MSKFWSGVVAASFVATVGLSGQEPAAPRGEQQPAAPRGEVGTSGAQAPASQSSSGQSKSITVSGCIQNAPSATAAAGGGAAGGATASASSGAKFVLAMKPAAGAGGAGAVGTAGAAATRYQLEGEDKEISTHLNHQVEITGTLQSSASSGGGGRW